MKIELRHHFTFESARFLPNLDDSHPCKKVHGHSFNMTLVIEGLIDKKIGWLVDYHYLKKETRKILDQIDHQLLNDISGLENPTTELLCFWLYKKLVKIIPQTKQIILCETHETECRYPVTTNPS